MRCLVLSAFLFVAPAFGQAPPNDAVRAKMQAFVDSGELSGAVALSGRAAGVDALEVVGKRDIEGGKPMEAGTLFRIASMTKPITAIAIMMLAERGKLAVEDPVEQYLPEFKGQRLVASRDKDALTLKKPARPIALKDLLTHTSGLPGGYPVGIADIYATRNRTLAECIAIQSQQPLDFEPGSKWSYCNTGIDTLGRIVEVVSKQSFPEFLKENLFAPLGMANTTFYPTADQLMQVATTYDRKDGKLVAVPKLFLDYAGGAKHPVPAGGLFSNASDLAKVYRMMLAKGMWDGKRILSEASIAAMTRVQTGDLKCGFTDEMAFGYGWAVVKKPTGITELLSAGSFGHGGAFGTQAWCDPVKDRFIVLLIQRTGLPNADASPIRRALQEAVFTPTPR